MVKSYFLFHTQQVVNVEDLKKSSVLLQNYHSSPRYHKSGKIGGKIAEEFDVDLSIVETMDISLKLGNVTKQEVVWQKLYDATNGKQVRPDHPLVKSIRKRPTKSLFLIGLIVTSGVVAQDNVNTMVSGMCTNESTMFNMETPTKNTHFEIFR